MDKQIIDQHDEKCQETKKRLQGNGITGPWDSEPNRLNWKHAGLDCMIVRNQNNLILCGYVGLPPGHPLHGKDYSGVDVEVHGGLTYADACGGHICHIPEPGEPDEVWWLGFDCAHGGDMMPGHKDILKQAGCPVLPGYEGTYRDLAYVKAETEQLAEQLADSKVSQADSNLS